MITLAAAAGLDELEACMVQTWTHAWATAAGQRQWCQLYRDLYRDERERALAADRAAVPGDNWGECKRLAAIIRALDEDIASRRAVRASRAW